MGRKLTYSERSSRERERERERSSRNAKRERERQSKNKERERERVADKREKEKEIRQQEREWEDQVKVFDKGIEKVNNPFLLIPIFNTNKRVRELLEKNKYTPSEAPILELPNIKLPHAPSAYKFIEIKQLIEMKRRSSQTIDKYFEENQFNPTSSSYLKSVIVFALFVTFVCIIMWIDSTPPFSKEYILFFTAMSIAIAINGYTKRRETIKMEINYKKSADEARIQYEELLKSEKIRQEKEYNDLLESHKSTVEKLKKEHAVLEQGVQFQYEWDLQEYKTKITKNELDYNDKEAKRIQTIESALNGDTQSMSLLVEARFPLHLTLEESDDLGFTSEDLNDHEIGYRIESNQEVSLVLNLSSLDFLPDQGIKLSTNRKKLTYYDINEKEKDNIYGNYICGLSLAYCASVAELLPTVKTIHIEADTKIKNPGTGMKEDVTILQSKIEVVDLKKLNYKGIEPQIAIGNFETKWNPLMGSSKKNIERSIDREALIYATEDDEGIDIAPHFRSIFDKVFLGLPEIDEEENMVKTINIFGDIELILVEGGPGGSYYISQSQVTFDQYDTFCEDVEYEKPEADFGRGKQPVINVNVADAVAYCKWLSIETGTTIRLPEEDEWEFAAKGGNKSKGYEYSGSDDIDEVAWYDENSEETTHEVATKEPNELGIFDMSGNVWEWCGTSGAFRGGSWGDGDDSCQVSSRHDGNPNGRDYLGVGFRILQKK